MILTVLAFWSIPGNLTAYTKRKGLVYRNCDVHFLFPAPVRPKKVLLYAHLKTLTAQILMNSFIVVCGGMIFAVEKWLFAADTIGCFILTKGSWIGFWGQIIVLFLLFITLIVHTWVFNDERFMSASGIKKKQLKKEAKQAWKNRKKGK